MKEMGGDVADSSLTADTGKTSNKKRGIFSNMFKAYTNDSERYSRKTTENFDPKYVLLLKICD